MATTTDRSAGAGANAATTGASAANAATAGDAFASLPTDQLSYQDLYARWERGNWRASEIDFGEDARQWRERFSEFERQAALWNYALFLWGEDAVADNLSPYIDAAPSEEQKYFLATQQVDEARHAVFFKRFMHEVCGIGDGAMASGLRAIRPQLSPGFRRIFERLDTMAQELRRDRSPAKLAAAITLYHVIIEAGLAQTGQHMIVGYLEQRELLPGFREGMRNVALDEQRHIGFGVKLLSDLQREDPRCRRAVAELLREMIPHTTQVLQPPGWDERYLTCFGQTFDSVNGEGVRSVLTKLRSAGLAAEALPGPPVIPPGLEPVEIARRGRLLAQAGIIGTPDGPAWRDPETVALLFDTLRLQVDHEHSPRRATTYQWEFTDPDIDAWHVTVGGEEAVARAGANPRADLRLRVSYQDWADIVGRRLHPRRALLSGRLRPRGNPLLLARMSRVFG